MCERFRDESSRDGTRDRGRGTDPVNTAFTLNVPGAPRCLRRQRAFLNHFHPRGDNEGGGIQRERDERGFCGSAPFSPGTMKAERQIHDSDSDGLVVVVVVVVESSITHTQPCA
ncbi:hypothetical protein EYF80_052023 [Liparis tanakae]|uniref:Uncharacterized protein n=1 Tax=Liparis tanakae TaxID=230148 RepID=A0A4Z2FA77_9TELE|nr:hypothetical protein EYF80_052023 [Liparis tanakae]